MRANKENAAIVFRHFPFFEGLEEGQLQELANVAQYQQVKKHSVIYREGSRSGQVYFLTQGVVKIGTHSGDGREVLKHVLHPMAMFGELSLAGEQERQDFAASMNQEVEVLSLKVSDLQQFMKADHRLAIRVLNFIGKRLQKAESRLESLIFKDARERIIEFLKESADKHGKRIGFEMLIKHSLTQQDIANITGTSRQTVTSVLNDLKKSNLIHFNRRSILIRDMGRLA
ncbi:MAG: Crp/Fnr family transcriptional regulator [Lewinellaceae bacterium]|nr:Crp/Fnr family transcriptional regulator [Phaeodactylibacter sp.]MCB9041709.1 Crp/Fnr family transcriptional regulator [Lewinellaceae bacterium]